MLRELYCHSRATLFPLESLTDTPYNAIDSVLCMPLIECTVSQAFTYIQFK